MPLTTYTFTFTPGGSTQTECGSEVLPAVARNVVEIVMRGCPDKNIQESIVIPQGAFVIIRPRLTTEGLPVEMIERLPRQLNYSFEGIDDAAFVYSDRDVYPCNMNASIPVFDDLSDPKVFGSLREIDNFLSYIGMERKTTGKYERDTILRLF